MKATSPPLNPQAGLTPRLHDRTPGKGYLETLYAERIQLAERLVQHAQAERRDLVFQTVMAMVVDAILLSSLGWMLAGSPRLVGTGFMAIRLIFSLGAALAALFFGISIVAGFGSLFYTNRVKGAPFLDPEEIATTMPSQETLLQAFQRSTQAKMTTGFLVQLHTEAINYQRQKHMLRWSILAMLVALFPYLIAIIFELVLLFF